MAAIPGSAGALVGDRCLGHDIGDAELGRHRRSDPVRGLVVEVIGEPQIRPGPAAGPDRPRSEEHTSELQSLMRISYAVFCLKKKNTGYKHNVNTEPPEHIK